MADPPCFRSGAARCAASGSRRSVAARPPPAARSARVFVEIDRGQIAGANCADAHEPRSALRGAKAGRPLRPSSAGSAAGCHGGDSAPRRAAATRITARSMVRKVSRKSFRSARAVVASPLMPTSVLAHITGTIWKIEVKPGDAVEEGQTPGHHRVDEDGDARRVPGRRQGRIGGGHRGSGRRRRGRPAHSWDRQNLGLCYAGAGRLSSVLPGALRY